MGDNPLASVAGSSASNSLRDASEGFGAAMDDGCYPFRLTSGMAMQQAYMQQFAQHQFMQQQFAQQQQQQMVNPNLPLRTIAPRVNGTASIVSTPPQINGTNAQPMGMRQFTPQQFMLHPSQATSNGMPVVMQGVSASFMPMVRPDGAIMMSSQMHSMPSCSTGPILVNGQAYMMQRNSMGSMVAVLPSSNGQSSSSSNHAVMTLDSTTPPPLQIDSQAMVEEIEQEGEHDKEPDSAENDDGQELPPALDRVTYDEETEEYESAVTGAPDKDVVTAELFVREAEEFAKKTATNKILVHNIDGYIIEECADPLPLFSDMKEPDCIAARKEKDAVKVANKSATVSPEAPAVPVPAKRGRRRKHAQMSTSNTTERPAAEAEASRTAAILPKKRGGGRRAAAVTVNSDDDEATAQLQDHQGPASDDDAADDTARDGRRRSKRAEAVEGMKRRSLQEQKDVEQRTRPKRRSRGSHDNFCDMEDDGDEDSTEMLESEVASKVKTTPQLQSSETKDNTFTDGTPEERCIACNELLKKSRLRKNPQYCSMVCRRQTLRKAKESSASIAASSPSHSPSPLIDEIEASQIRGRSSSTAAASTPKIPASPKKIHSFPNKPADLPSLSNQPDPVGRNVTIGVSDLLSSSSSIPPTPVRAPVAAPSTPLPSRGPGGLLTVPDSPANKDAVPVYAKKPHLWTLDETHKWLSVVTDQDTAGRLLENACDAITLLTADPQKFREAPHNLKFGPFRKLGQGLAYLRLYYDITDDIMQEDIISAANLSNMDPGKWTCDDVHSWVLALRCADDAASKLRHEEIDGKVLLTMTEEDFKNDIGIDAFADINKLQACVKFLQKISKATDASP